MPLPLPCLDLLDLKKLELDLLELLLDVPLDFSGVRVSTPFPEEVRESLEQRELLPHLLTSWTGVQYQVELVFGRLQVWLLHNFRWLASLIFQVEAVHQQSLAKLFCMRADDGLHFHGETRQIPWRITVARPATLGQLRAANLMFGC